jgi:hypothetical protein
MAQHHTVVVAISAATTTTIRRTGCDIIIAAQSGCVIPHRLLTTFSWSTLFLPPSPPSRIKEEVECPPAPSTPHHFPQDSSIINENINVRTYNLEHRSTYSKT